MAQIFHTILKFVESPGVAKNAQIILIIQYAVLAGIFGLNKKTWPVSLYYIGCFVKDTGVFALAFLGRLFG